MTDPQIEKLLILQHRDVTLQRIQSDLDRAPKERAAIDATIARETNNIEEAREALKSKELERKEVDSEVKAKETTLQRFRTQQLEVKKNDEYKALTHQIELTEQEISALEEREIELMLEIDTIRETFEKERGTIEKRIETAKGEIVTLGERVKNLEASKIEAAAEAKKAEEGVDPNYLEHYFRVKKLVKRAPYLAPIESQKCSGCHLRVSNEIARGVLNVGELHFCDQCARIVYSA